jgi:hypothetical protein
MRRSPAEPEILRVLQEDKAVFETPRPCHLMDDAGGDLVPAGYLSSVMNTLEWFELASYIVTVIGLPFAIAIFVLEQRKERKGEEEEIFQRLSDEYREFLKLVLENPDLHLLRRGPRSTALTDEQEERRLAIFGILISLFERAYLLVYEKKMDRQTQRMWKSWEDYMTEWVRHEDFRRALPVLLDGEDEEFGEHIRELARRVPPQPAAVTLGKKPGAEAGEPVLRDPR